GSGQCLARRLVAMDEALRVAVVLADAHFQKGPVVVDDGTGDLQAEHLAAQDAVLDHGIRARGPQLVGQRRDTRVERRLGRPRLLETVPAAARPLPTARRRGRPAWPGEGPAFAGPLLLLPPGAVAALEALDAPAGVDQLLLAGEERVALVAELDVEVGHGRA